MSPVRFSLPLILLASLVGLAGCTELKSEPRRSPSGNAGRQGATASSPGTLANQPAGVTRTTRIRAQVLPLGFVPYDNNTLPLASPDGRYLAAQTGIAPTWDTILAKPEASVPYATRIEVYELSERGEESPRLAFALNEPAMLGRACDAEGFLIEAVRDDGSRWIGRVNWETGELEWLVNDNAVNAFATLGPDGRLAWSRRPVDGQHFDLVIRRASQQFTIPSSGNDWLLPTFSGRGDGLFVLSLANKFLDMTYAQASSPQAFGQSLQRIVLKRDASRWAAYQTLAGQVTVAGGPPPPRDELVFHYIDGSRSVIWRPLAGGNRPLTLLHSGSYAAAPTGDGHVLTATEEALLLQNLQDVKDTAELLAGLLIPRLTPRGDWPFLLLETEEGRVAVTAMRLLPGDVDLEELRRTDGE